MDFMVRALRMEREGMDMTYYQCEECGLLYEDELWAARCEGWCREHHSCNLEIIRRAVGFQNE